MSTSLLETAILVEVWKARMEKKKKVNNKIVLTGPQR